MSKDTNLNFEQAYAVAHNNVYAPVFFEKLAQDYNIAPESAEDVTQMLVLAKSLREKYEQEKSASGGQVSKLLKAAAAKLQPELSQQSDEVAVKQAAAQIAADPEIKAALKVLLSTGK